MTTWHYERANIIEEDIIVNTLKRLYGGSYGPVSIAKTGKNELIIRVFNKANNAFDFFKWPNTLHMSSPFPASASKAPLSIPPSPE